MRTLSKETVRLCTKRWILAIGIVMAGQSALSAQTVDRQPSPKTWIDQDTGHRITRVSGNSESRGLYFNYQSTTPDGRFTIFVSHGAIYTSEAGLDPVKMIVKGPVMWTVVGAKTGTIFYALKNDTFIYGANPVTGELRRLFALPPRALPHSVNADETLLAGTFVEGSEQDVDSIKLPDSVRPSKAALMEYRAHAKIPMDLFTESLTTGKIQVILKSTDWLNHILFSPTHPDLLLYCHEGLWQNVDRIWTIHADGSRNALLHVRTVPGEVAGHEFWGPDGETVWYDLQIPKGKNFYLANVNVATGIHKRYRLEKNQWSTHFNISPDGKWAAGDGGDEFQVANAPNGRWIQLFQLPRDGDPAQDTEHTPLASEYLVNLAHHEYTTEPNVHFSADSKRVLFTSAVQGGTHLFAVDIGAEIPEKRRLAVRDKLPDLKEDAMGQVQIVDASGQPVSSADVELTSLDGSGLWGKFKTGKDGRTPAFRAVQGLSRIIVTCAGSACNRKVIEAFDWQLVGMKTIATNTVVTKPSEPAEMSTSVVIEDKIGKPLKDIYILVRSEDASSEKWYRTDKSGKAMLNISQDPSTMVVLFERYPLEYAMRRSCDGASSVAAAAERTCLVLKPQLEVQVGNTIYRDTIIGRESGH